MKSCTKCVHWDKPPGFEKAVSINHHPKVPWEGKPVPVGECLLRNWIIPADFAMKCNKGHKGIIS